MNLSYWEIKSWFTNVDFTIIGSGIVGLNTALYLKEKYPKVNIVVLEKGMLPEGASTKNAGFACFGSLSEIIEDLKTHTEEEVVQLVKKRWEGLQLLRKNLGDAIIDYQQHGGYELFYKNDPLWEECSQNRSKINALLKPLFTKDVFTVTGNIFDFKEVHQQYVYNPFEGQLDTGKMVATLLQKVQGLGIKVLTNCFVESFEELKQSVQLRTNQITFKTTKLFITTNGFAKQFIDVDMQPARAQVLITKPIKNLHIKGTFHLDKGYYYFRNIDDRILFGGARNLDFKTEETTEFGLTEKIQNRLEELLRKTILPNTNVEIEHRWSGIMGVGSQKKPIIKQLSENVYCGVRLGGMGVAIGSLLGKELAGLV
ncbi:MAG: FAD-dependent oxidoreductase [Flavobacteriaceae bacterium]|jgi:glycine/D-amino acid oxidase-like deaminating enzyme